MWKVFRRSSGEVPDELVVLRTTEIRQQLLEEGFEKDKVDEVLKRLITDLSEEVQEKRILEYDEFLQHVTVALERLYHIPTQRLKLCKQIQKFVECNPEVSNSAKLYASYITYGAAETQLDEYKVVVSGEDTEQVQKAQKFIQQWERQSKIKRFIYMCAKDLVIYGDAFLEKIYDANKRVVGVAYIPATTMYVKLKPSGVPEKYYQVIDEHAKFADLEVQDTLATLLGEKKVIEFEPQEIIHFNDGSAVGTTDSPIRSLLVQWRMVKLLEEALIIHRVTRASRFIVFFLDVTGKTKKEVSKAVYNFTSRLKRIFRLDPEAGEVQSTKSTLPTTADLVIPVTKGSATRVQAVPSDPSAVKIDDLRFYTHRVTNNLLTSHIFSPDKTGKEEYIEKAFLRLVRIYQKQMQYTLEDLYRQVLFENGFNDIDVSIVFPSPDTAEEVKIIDSVVRRMMVVNQLIATTGIVPPTSWIIDYVFKDMTQLEVRQLVNMLKYAQEEQEQAAEGEEYPSLLANTEQLLQKPIQTPPEEREEEESKTLPLKITEQMLKDLFYNPDSSKVTESRTQHRLQQAIELSMKFLEGRKEWLK